MIVHIDNEHIRIGTDNGILFFTYKNGISIDLPTAIVMVAHRLFVQNGKSLPVLCNVTGVQKITRLARIYLSKQGTVLVERLALVSTSERSTAIAKFYLAANARSERTRFFRDENTALQFLRSF